MEDARRISPNCVVCGKLIDKPSNTKVTVQKYCSKECRSAFWNEARAVGATWKEMCDVRYGAISELELSESDKVWLACAIDGEGTIGVYRERRPANRSKYRYFLVVEVFNTNKEFVEKAAALMNGTVVTKTVLKKNHKALLKATASRRKAAPVLRAVLPHLVIKARQAELGLKFAETLGESTMRTEDVHCDLEKIWLEMKGLNKRGIHSQEPSGS